MRVDSKPAVTRPNALRCPQARQQSMERLPSLRMVRAIVRACEADVGQWEGAWRAIETKAFHLANPRPADLGKI